MGFDKRYYIDIPIYELKYAEDNEWNTVSEKAALEDLLDNFERITPIIREMLHGKEINTQRGIFRIKNYWKLNRTYQFKQA
jgi:hypothetical protein